MEVNNFSSLSGNNSANVFDNQQRNINTFSKNTSPPYTYPGAYRKISPDANYALLPGAGMILYGIFDGIKNKIQKVKNPFKEALRPAGPIVIGAAAAFLGWAMAAILLDPYKKNKVS